MFRRQPLTKQIQVRLTNRTLDQLERLADDLGTTRSDVVRRLIVDNARREPIASHSQTERGSK